MSHVTVFNSAFRSFKIPTTPEKYLTEVRDEACKKFSVSPDHFTLKYNNKPISLSQQIRLANLPPGARLELVQASRSPTVISVALQLPASENNVRLTEKLASNTSLWEILRHFESKPGVNYNFTQRGVPELNGSAASGAGRLNYEMPVITVMPGHREQSSFVGLQQTLNQLGFDSGSALLKLSFKNSGTPLEEAMAQISQYFKASDSATDPPAAGAHSADSAQASLVPNPDKAASEASGTVAGEEIKQDAPEPASPMEVDSAPATESAPPFLGGSATVAENAAPAAASPIPTPTPSSPPSSSANGGRNVQIYSAPTSSTPQAARNAWNDADFVPTIEHAKAHQASLQNRTRNQRLLSDKELEAEEAARQEKIAVAAEKGSVLRIRLPDQSIIQMNATKTDTAIVLYSFVENLLEYKEPFHLKYQGGKGGQQVVIPRSDARLIQDLKFGSKELVTFLWDDNASNEARLSRKTLSKEWQDKAQKLVVQEPVANEPQEEVRLQTKAEGKRKAGTSKEDKESKLKSILGKGLFKR